MPIDSGDSLAYQLSIDEPTNKAPQYVEVAIPLHVSKTFVYRLPEEQFGEVGERILVPLGRNLVTGFIVDVHDKLDEAWEISESDIKSSGEVLDSVPVCTPEVLAITRWVSEYYASPWGEVIKSALPPGISPAIHEFIKLTSDGEAARLQTTSEETATKRILKRLSDEPMRRDNLNGIASPAQITKSLRELEQAGLIERTQAQSTSFVKTKLVRFAKLANQRDDISQERKPTPAQLKLIEVLSRSGPMPVAKLLDEAGVGPSAISTLEKSGRLIVYNEAVRRDPFYEPLSKPAVEYALTTAQLSVLEDIQSAIKTQSYSAFLLHGVTGSGKTEVYIRAMKSALDLGKSAMMLVPEIALTPVFSKRLREYFGDKVAIFHSSLQPGERFDEWTRVKNGEARVIIGTRSAVFAPAKNLGVIVVDEEHEASYRQQDSPYYNGRDTAIVRAQKESAVVVLGSATPSLESFHNAKAGKYRYLSLPERIAARPLAAASIVDMRAVFARSGKPRVFSEELLDAIKETHERNEQSIILLNRRGYSSYITCRSCGDSIQCPNCDVTLTFHRSERVMICHYCNHRQPSPKACPSCGAQYIHYVGEGTEQLEEMLKQAFPELRIARIDRDTTSNRRRFERSLKDFSEGHLDMLVGTQMLAKGHDFPNVTLVGVVSVDAGLSLPDFRAAERTFQLITQVAGRAGRGDRPGRVLIQTYHPEHYALQHACAQDYEGFYNEEIRYRQNYSYPPFVALGSFLVHGPDLNKVRTDAQELRKKLDGANADRTVRILGPAPAPLSRLKGEHRFQLLIKSRSRKRLREVADAALKSLADSGTNLRSINLEIDPVSMM